MMARIAKISDRKYQNLAYKLLVQNDGGALYLRPGAGKTLITIRFLEFVKRKTKKKFKALIMAPRLVALDSWPRELNKWSPKLTYNNIWENGYKEGFDISITNPEKFIGDMEKGLKYSDTYNCFIFDESSMIKSPFANRTIVVHRWLELMRAKVKYRVIQTGTVITKDLINLWAQHTVVDPEALGKNFYHYRSRYFVPDARNNDWHIKEGSAEKIISLIAKKSFILDDEMEKQIGYPKVTFNDIRFDLDERTRKKYDKLYKSFELEFEEVFSKETIAFDITKHLNKLYKGCISYTYMSQLVSGFLYQDKIPKVVHRLRYEVAANLKESIGSQSLLIFTHYKQDVEALLALKKKGYKVGVIQARMKPLEIKAIIKIWNAGEFDVLLLPIQIGAKGLNIQDGGHHVLFFNIPDDYDLYYQAYHRLVRSGQKFCVTIHRIICNNTMDIRRIMNLSRKIKTASEFRRLLIEEKNKPKTRKKAS
jgi:SNF2 family DNA or RNA helicase